MRTAAQWLDEYGASHQNPTNEILHWICVPVIEWCVVGLLWLIPVPAVLRDRFPFAHWAGLVIAVATLYYVTLSRSLALGALFMMLLMLASVAAVDRVIPGALPWVCGSLFVIAWIGQFIGHAIEGRRPSFFKDLQFLLIGPIWLLSSLYRRMHIPV